MSHSRTSASRGAFPRAPWGGFPLSELCVLGGLFLSAAGLAMWNQRALLFCTAGLLLAVLGGAELALRQHLARRRPQGGSRRR
jgi:hypothetical protein